MGDRPEKVDLASAEIDRLRSYRKPRSRDHRITDTLQKVRRQAARSRKQNGNLVDLWLAEVPGNITSRSSVSITRAGVVHAVVSDAATGYELDHLLREGLLIALQQSYPGPLARVRITVGNLDLD